MSEPLLLDTCAVLWIAQGELLSDEAEAGIEAARAARRPISVSPITAWEVGLLAARGRIAISRDIDVWFADLLALGFELAPLPPQTLIASSFLPGAAPRDPADRILAATARRLNARLVTRDQVLLDYAQAGHLSALAC